MTRRAARAILVGVQFGGRAGFDETLDELALLAESAGDEPVARVIARRKAPDPALFIGSGKADEIKALVLAHQAEAVLFDQALSPAQQRNLERHLGVAVADRTMLILEIFGERAPRATRASCRSSWHVCNTWRPGWCAAGATSSASAAVSAAAAGRVRRRSNSIAG